MASHSTVARSGTSRPNRLAATAATAALTLALLFISPSSWTLPLLLLFASVTWAMALANPRGETQPANATVVGWVPLAFAGLVALIALAGMAASWLGIDIWSTPTKATFLWIIVITIPVALSWKRRGSIRFVGQDQPAAVLLAVTMLAGLVLVLTVPIQVLTRNVNGGTDFVRHLSGLLKPTIEVGQLSYASSGYPRGLHALVGSALPAFSDGSYQAGWIALEGIAWVLIVLSATALAVAAGRVATAVGLTSQWWRYAAAIATVVIFLQGAVIESFLFGGFVTSLLALLLVCAAVATTLSIQNARSQAYQLALLTAAMAQAWQLLVPVIAAPLVYLWLRALVTRTDARRITGACVGAALVTLPPFIPLVRQFIPTSPGDQGGSLSLTEISAAVASEGSAGLAWPGGWWIIAAPLAFVAVISLWRRRAFVQVTSWLVMVLGAGTLVIGLWLLARDANSLPYYVLKSLWSVLPILLPMTLVGATLLIVSVVRFPDRWPDPIARVSRAVIVAILVIGAIAGFGGQWAGQPPTALRLADGLGAITYQLPALSALERGKVKLASEDTVIFWGLAPSLDPGILALRTAGLADLQAVESLPWLGIPVSWPGGYSLSARNTEAICQYLRENPETVRITGPNPQSGAQWLLDSGCPKNVVRPADWQVIDIDESWFEGREELLPYSYPTWEEAQQSFIR